MEAVNVAPVDVFISYSEDDESFKKQLETHLALLKRQKIIQPWHSQQAAPGSEWEQETANRIRSAQIILLLISPSFLASDQLYYNEMMYAMERHEAGAARVVPIIVRSVELSETPFSKLVALPRNRKPIDIWRNTDEVWASIVVEIRQLCKQVAT
jgi:TIR domain